MTRSLSRLLFSAATACVLVLPAALPVHAQTPAKPAATKRAPPPPPPAPTLPQANEDQRFAAGLTHLGKYECEFNEVVNIDPNAAAGYIDVKHRKELWTMKPVLSSTGAIRLEDVKGRMLVVQIANKSMLMDTKVGRRLVDNCVHEKQREAANRPPGESIGIDPSKAAPVPPPAAASAPR